MAGADLVIQNLQRGLNDVAQGLQQLRTELQQQRTEQQQHRDGAAAAQALMLQQLQAGAAAAQVQMLQQLQAGAAAAQAQLLLQLQAGAAAAQAHHLQQLAGVLALHGLVSAEQRCAAARRANAAASSAPFVVLPRADGSAPPAWPAGMDRAALRQLGGAAASALLADFALANGGTLDAKRARLAHFIGAAF